MLHDLLLCCVHTISELAHSLAHQTVSDGISDFTRRCSN